MITRTEIQEIDRLLARAEEQLQDVNDATSSKAVSYNAVDSARASLEDLILGTKKIHAIIERECWNNNPDDRIMIDQVSL